MKCAIISVSRTGALLGSRVKSGITGDITLYERIGAESGNPAEYFRRTLKLTAEIFSDYDGLLFIMASGIAVRAVAPLIVSKARDPAVLVMDECGKHCISLLSGHLGGANAWAREVASAIGADPVITTATDVHEFRAPDDIARELMMRVYPLPALKPINSLIAEGRNVIWFLDEKVNGANSISFRLKEKGIEAIPLEKISDMEFDGCIIISDYTYQQSKPCVFLRPKNLFIGIGCKRGTPENLIRDAYEQALMRCGIYEYQVASLASVDLKADEKGLLDFAFHKNLPIHFYKAEELKRITEDYHLDISQFVEKTIGVGNVCQSAALMESKKGKTVLPKTKFASATVAIAKGLSGSLELDRVIKRK